MGSCSSACQHSSDGDDQITVQETAYKSDALSKEEEEEQQQDEHILEVAAKSNASASQSSTLAQETDNIIEATTETAEGPQGSGASLAKEEVKETCSSAEVATKSSGNLELQPDENNDNAPTAKDTPCRLQDLDADTKAKIQELLSKHEVFEAHALCPEYVESQGYMKKFRDTVELMCGSSGQKWEKTITGALGDDGQWRLQYFWDGETPGAGGKDYLWVKLAIDQDIEWWRQLGGFHEPDLDMKANSILVDAKMIGNPSPTYAIRCNIQCIFGKMFGCTQEYLEVSRFLNRESGFCVECNSTIDHEELEKRGYNVGKQQHKKGSDMLLYVISFPRSADRSTCVLYTRFKMFLPTWMVNKLVSSLGPYLVRSILPKLTEQQKNNPEYQKRFAEDKQGLYAYFKDFQENCLEAAATRTTKYSAVNLPPPDVVIGRYVQAT